MYKNVKKGEPVHHSVYGKGVFLGKTQTHYLVTFVSHGTQLIKIPEDSSDTLQTKNANQPCNFHEVPSIMEKSLQSISI